MKKQNLKIEKKEPLPPIDFKLVEQALYNPPKVVTQPLPPIDFKSAEKAMVDPPKQFAELGCQTTLEV